MRYWCIPYSSGRTHSILKTPCAFKMYGLGITVTVCPAWNLCAFIVQLPFELGPGRPPGIDSAEGCKERKARSGSEVNVLKIQENWAKQITQTRLRIPSVLAYRTDSLPC